MIAEALLDRETLDREEVESLAKGEPLPEAKLVKQAREFAESLRRDSGGKIGAEAPDASAQEKREAGSAREEVVVKAKAEPDPSH
jgi:hypothetical protein